MQLLNHSLKLNVTISKTKRNDLIPGINDTNSDTRHRIICSHYSKKNTRDFKSIMITIPCYVYPLTPHFYIVKLGFTGVYIFFLFLL